MVPWPEALLERGLISDATGKAITDAVLGASRDSGWYGPDTQKFNPAAHTDLAHKSGFRWSGSVLIG